MCDPTTLLYGLGGMVAARAMAPSAPEIPAIAAQPDPAVERLKAETVAANAANQKLAADKQMRRANVLASGGEALGAGQAVTQPGGKTTVLGGAGS